MKPKLIFKFCAAMLCASACFSASAQKLPNKQEKSVWAPTNVKIDGKANEWSAGYQAKNMAIGASYVIANDDENLYLSIHVTDRAGIFYKAMSGGITFIVKTSAEKVSTRYPVFSYKELPSFDAPQRGQIFSADTEDPIVVKNNTLFASKAKEIGVRGIKGVDTIISIFNDQGIKAAGRFDDQLGYRYELCIPLKYLGLSQNDAGFKYQILLNGGPDKYTVSAASQLRISGIKGPDGTPAPQAEVDAANAVMAGLAQARYATTDVAGEYTMAKRP
ncbi:hypothetical protein [Mucilaginibacter myungsuensis]|uniref:Uncharacterized protein n=1 Tax=Mucilaginibacter myungsuensis TaxID=649104 RepID=A0A929KTG8_9SPHI|nr:hypothetical protein [Mucilaginibacter myungsuensis]MBE9661254.1 hypothetical protein [Mucilaginibacter myungsuensis]MDN3597397.1 hypothetical protein [Mucilaginibacter myungsuensis]